MGMSKSLLCLGGILCCLAANAQTVDQQSWKIEPGEMSAKQAGKIAASYAQKLGLKDLDIKAYRCFARSTTGDDGKKHREWLFYKNNDQTDYQFCIETRTGELLEYANWKLVKKNLRDNSEEPGVFVQTRSAMSSHATKYIKLLGLPQPLALRLNGPYDHEGRLKKPFMMASASYDRKGRYFSLVFDKQTGELYQFSVQNNRDFADNRQQTGVRKVDAAKLAKAQKAAMAFAREVGLGNSDPQDVLTSYDGGPGVPKAYFGVQHPLWFAIVDARSMRVSHLSTHNFFERFNKGDKPCVTKLSDAASLVHRYGSKLGLDRSLLTVKITNGVEKRYGWVGWIDGEYRNGNKVIARIRLGLYKGELITINYDPAGIPEPRFKN